MRRLVVAVALALGSSPLLAQPVSTAPALPSPSMIFFEWGRTSISRDSAAVLDQVVATFRQSSGLQVLLAAHSDRSGSERTNLRSSQRRADSVRAYLVARGVPDSAIASTASGEERPLIPTEDGVREAQNRRVEIAFGRITPE